MFLVMHSMTRHRHCEEKLDIQIILSLHTYDIYGEDKVDSIVLSRNTALLMMTSSNGNISKLLAFCEGNSPATGEFPSQRPMTRSLIFSLICAWANGWANNRDVGDLRRHRNHYDVTVMLPKTYMLMAILYILQSVVVICHWLENTNVPSSPLTTAVTCHRLTPNTLGLEWHLFNWRMLGSSEFDVTEWEKFNLMLSIWDKRRDIIVFQNQITLLMGIVPFCKYITRL